MKVLRSHHADVERQLEALLLLLRPGPAVSVVQVLESRDLQHEPEERRGVEGPLAPDTISGSERNDGAAQ
jgi:hypothetical protein